MPISATLGVSLVGRRDEEARKAERSTRSTLLTEASCSAERPTKHRLGLIQTEAGGSVSSVILCIKAASIHPSRGGGRAPRDVTPKQIHCPAAMNGCRFPSF